MERGVFSRGTIGKKIKQLRGQRSRQAFASRLGVHKNTLANYELGIRNPTSWFLVALCRIENVDPCWLLGGPEKPERQHNRHLLERIGNILSILAPRHLKGKTSKLLVNVYERAVETGAEDDEIEHIVLGMLELLEHALGTTRAVPNPVKTGEKKQWPTE